jgi:hypothetical protein
VISARSAPRRRISEILAATSVFLRGRGLGREHRRVTARRDYDGHLATDKVGSERGQTIIVTLSPAIYDLRVLPKNDASFAQTPMELAKDIRGIASPSATEEPDHRQGRLLRACGERPCSRRAAKQDDEIAPSYT